jgi:hypothetical protein
VNPGKNKGPEGLIKPSGPCVSSDVLDGFSLQGGIREF